MSQPRFAAGERLGRAFYERPVDQVAPDLLGKTLVHRDPAGLLTLRIVEVEAYRGEGEDPASHAHRGRTSRNRNMFATPGRLYVYLCYGVHHCLNVVCAPDGRAGAILLRGAEVLHGAPLMGRRRGQPGVRIANGPGKLGQALAANLEWDGRTLLRGVTGIWPGPAPRRIVKTTRIGISKGRALRLRFLDPDSPGVSPARPVL